MPKQFLSAISITIGLLTTLVVNTGALAQEVRAFSQAQGTQAPAPWRFVGLPERYAKPATVIDITTLDGSKTLQLSADKAWGSLAHPWTGPAQTVRFQWRLDKPLTTASLKTKATEDAALKVCLSFDMPTDRIPSSERTLFRLAQFVSKDKLPTATLCYVWAQVEDIGSLHPSPTTARVRYLVLNNSNSPAKTWQAHTRNLSADFTKAFGAESATMPTVTAIIVGADSDNTQGNSLGYIADIVVQP